MALLDALFSSPEIGDIFSDRARLQRMLDFEAALAKAEARSGIVPQEAAMVIAGKCGAELLDIPALAEAAKLSANPAIPLVTQLTALVAEENKEAARFVHWGQPARM